MGKISVGDVVFVSFPFSDLSHAKLRPALVLAYAQREDWVLCQITSKSYSDSKAIRIDEIDYARGTLNCVSYVRPSKLFTANEQLINKNVATLKYETYQRVINAIQRLLSDGE